MSGTLLWLCRDFRFNDNAALAAAAAAGPVLPVFVIDRALRRQGAASRWRLEEALRAFDAEWHQRTGQHVLVLQGEAEDLLPPLAQRLAAGEIHQNDWPTPAQQATQERLRNALGKNGPRLRLHRGHLLTHPRQIRTGTGGVYRVYSAFARAVYRHGVDQPCASPGRLTAQHAPEEAGTPLAALDLAPDLFGGRRVLERFALPAGEKAAGARLDWFLDEAAADYPQGRDRPDQPVTSGLSEHLALGEISPRQIWAIAEARRQGAGSAGRGIDKFLSEVLWREFAWHLYLDFPALDTRPWREEWAAFPWRGDNTQAQDWRRATTGIPLVDAGLREMRVTGRMHNRVRMVVASYLTKHLLTNWRLGLAHFADSLTDWDPAANAMNWQWVAGCGPDASPFFRVFNPVRQAEQHDPKGAYRARWLAGWRGAPTPEAAAYLETLPRHWTVPDHYRELSDETALAAGRLRALAAYDTVKSSAQSGDPG